jgi:hypothetical protein
MDEILERLSAAEKQLLLVKKKRNQRDLQKMISNIDKVITEISRESVECRRLKKETTKYKDLLVEATKLLDNLEHQIIFAMLLG